MRARTIAERDALRLRLQQQEQQEPQQEQQPQQQQQQGHTYFDFVGSGLSMLGCDPYLACGICAESRLEPNPSYFLAVLHKRLVGTGVLLVTHVLLGRSGQLRLLACVEPVLAGACPAGRDFETRPPLRVPYDTYTAPARPGAGARSARRRRTLLEDYKMPEFVTQTFGTHE